jgi:low affinity Fe/Cu permease
MKKKRNKLSWFTRAAKWASHKAGRPSTFMIALSIILIWAITGPIFHFSDTWQLVINTSTTIITFLMVFLIQNTQNRDTEALQIKLDELIRAIESAHNVVLDLEELDDKELDDIRKDYLKLAEAARDEIKRKKTKQ